MRTTQQQRVVLNNMFDNASSLAAIPADYIEKITITKRPLTERQQVLISFAIGFSALCLFSFVSYVAEVLPDPTSNFIVSTFVGLAITCLCLALTAGRADSA